MRLGWNWHSFGIEVKRVYNVVKSTKNISWSKKSSTLRMSLRKLVSLSGALGAADQHLVSAANPQVSHSESQIPSLARKSETTTRAIMVETFLPPPHVTVYSTRTIDTSTSCTVRNLPNFAGLQVCPPLVRNPPFNLTFKGIHTPVPFPLPAR